LRDYKLSFPFQKFNNFVEQSLANGCTNDLTFFCAYTFRGCNKENMLDAIGPCFETCIDQCFDQPYSYCANEGLTKIETSMPEDDIKFFEKFALPTIKSGCSNVAKFFYCGVVFPLCDENSGPKYPCKKYCV
ncbi:unnamed protein product, partial [Candidula unifasciata]